MLRLLGGVSPLRGEPARERLAVLVKDHAAKWDYLAIDHHPMAMALVLIAGFVLPVEHGARWIKRAAQRPTVNAINETCLISGCHRVGTKVVDLIHERIA